MLWAWPSLGMERYHGEELRSWSASSAELPLLTSNNLPAVLEVDSLAPSEATPADDGLSNKDELSHYALLNLWAKSMTIIVSGHFIVKCVMQEYIIRTYRQIKSSGDWKIKLASYFTFFPISYKKKTTLLTMEFFLPWVATYWKAFSHIWKQITTRSPNW